jgi:hypothetical protein
MLALLQEATSQVPVGLQEWVAWATIVQGFGTPLLIAIGGFFAWYKFIRQGEHDPRLQATVEAEEVAVLDSVAYIIAKIGVENTGQVDVDLNLEPSALYVVGRKAGHRWSDPDPAYTYDVFVGQNKVQVNATIRDRVWIERDLTDEVALSLQLAVSGKAGKESRDWRTSHIISLLDGGHLARNG